MIVGVGVDMVEAPRMERILRSPWAERFLKRVFSREEIEACRDSANPAEGYAARFAAKEAMAKALGTGFSKGVTPGSIEVLGGEGVKPELRLTGAAHDAAEQLGITNVQVSLTHTRKTACAFVTAESD